MPYYRIGFTTAFCGVDEDKIVHSESVLKENDIDQWAHEEVQVSPIFEEIDEDEIDEDEKEWIEEF